MTSPTRDQEAALQRLRDVLDTFGADDARWPMSSRAELEAVLERSADARALLREARALDALLDQAPALDRARMDALAIRIVGAATASSQRTPEAVPPERGGDVVRFPQRRQAPVSSAWREGPARTAALLAASLLMGIFAGTTLVTGDAGTIQPSTFEVADDPVIRQIVADDDTIDLIEEEFL